MNCCICYTLRPPYNEVISATKMFHYIQKICYKHILAALCLTELFFIYFIITDNLLYRSLSVAHLKH